MSLPPLITVLMPAYNAEQYVAQAIESILNQTYTNFEFLIFEDASTDRTLKIIQQFDDERIQLYCTTVNRGYIHHLANGLSIARGKYLARMDADDIALPERLAKQVHFLETHPKYAIVGTQAQYLFGDGDRPSRLCSNLHTDETLLATCTLFYSPFFHPTVMMRTAVAQKYGYSDRYAAEDIHLWGQLLTEHPGTNLPERLLYYRVHQNNTSIVKSQHYLEGIRRLTAARLDDMEIPYTEQDLDVHCMLFGLYKKPLTVNDLRKIERWLQFFKSINQQKQIYAPHALAIVLGYTWYNCCTRAKHLGWKAFRIFLQSSLSQNGSRYNEKIGLLVKCILHEKGMARIYRWLERSVKRKI